MNNHEIISIKAPGVYLITGNDSNIPEASIYGNYSVWQVGKLSCKTESDAWALHFDGILFRDYSTDVSDADYLLNTFTNRFEIDDLLRIHGFYNAILIHKSGNKGFLFGDDLAARPQYLYQQKEKIGYAPTPFSFAEMNLEMNLNRTNLLEFIRFRYNSYQRTMIDEVERCLPGHYYSFDQNGNLESHKYLNFDQENSTNITLESAADWVYEICKKPMEATFDHPVLKKLEVHLPLTAGLDSRHLLGQVLESDKKPASLRHINISERDLEPVKKISKALDIPLNAPSIKELDYSDLMRRFLERSGGLANIHQFYLLQIKDMTPENGALGFNGQLMDKFLGLAPVTSLKSGLSVADSIWKKKFTGKSILDGLFVDSKEIIKNLYRIRSHEIDSVQGEDWYKIAIDEFHQKSLHYTGITDTMVSDDYFSFSPGSSYESLDFIRTVPYKIAGKKKARLEALKRYFPEVGAFPDDDGIPLIEKLDRPRISKSPFSKNISPLLKWVFSGFSGDPAPSTEHEWLRKIPTLKAIHRKMVYDGHIFKDNILSQNAAFASWSIHQFGGFQAWTLMSLLSAEMAYQLLCKKHSLDDVMSWLND